MTNHAPADRFDDRHDAGRRLGDVLGERDVDADIVLAIPRGGLPLGRALADVLELPLDVVVASKIGAPNNPEFAIGAVGSDGSLWLDRETIDRVGIEQDYVDRERQSEQRAAREKAATYRDGATEPDVRGRRVVLVDDGAATGSTAIAALRLLESKGAAHVIVALPVAPPQTVDTLTDLADEVVCLLEPESFRAVGQFYDRFGQVSDREAMDYLDGDVGQRH